MGIIRYPLRKGYRQVLCANSFTSLAELSLHRAGKPALNYLVAEDRERVKGGETTVEYDLLGRIIAITDPTGAATAYSYDANGNLLSVTDALRHATKSEGCGLSLARDATGPVSTRVAVVPPAQPAAPSTTVGRQPASAWGTFSSVARSRARAACSVGLLV